MVLVYLKNNHNFQQVHREFYNIHSNTYKADVVDCGSNINICKRGVLGFGLYDVDTVRVLTVQMKMLKS